MRHLLLRVQAGQHGPFLVIKIHAWGHDQSIVTECAAQHGDFLKGGVYGGHRVMLKNNTVIGLQGIVAKGQVVDALAATQNQIAHGAGYKLAVGLNQHHLDGTQAPQAQVFRGRGAGIATADDDHATQGRLAGHGQTG